jgi:hypothetical protein
MGRIGDLKMIILMAEQYVLRHDAGARLLVAAFVRECYYPIFVRNLLSNYRISGCSWKAQERDCSAVPCEHHTFIIGSTYQ